MTRKTQTIDSWLIAHSTHQPDKIALSFEGQNWSYHELHNWVLDLSGKLEQTHGLKRGDRLAYLGKNSATQVALMFAAARLGLIFVPLNWRLSPSELNYMVKDCAPALLFYTPEFGDQSEAIINDTETPALPLADANKGEATRPAPSCASLEDPYLIVYTSGTTGRPKGAVITQEAVLWNAIISLHAHDFTPQDHTLNLLPLFHVGGINIQMMPSFFVGGRVTLHAAFDPKMALKALEEEGITSTVCVPTVMAALLADPSWKTTDFPALRLINTGSTDVPVEILTAVQARGIPMVQVYGTTETGPIATYQKEAEAKTTKGSIGRSGAHVQVQIRREDGSQSAPDEPGEIWVKGPNNFSHYWNDEQATLSALTNGWFKTGDIATKDDQGLFWFKGRSKHVIISGGENIYPAELERILQGLDGLKEACVVGRPDKKWGEVPIAVVVASSENAPSKDQILSAFSDHIARFKQPKDVVFLDELPKNALGKVLIDQTRKKVMQ